MNCTNHNFAGASGICVTCGKPYCSDCLVDVGGRYQCRECLSNSRGALEHTRSNSGDSSGTGKAVLWVFLILFFPFIGIFAGKAKPFGKTGNIISQIYGWLYVMAFVAFIVFASIGATVSTSNTISGVVSESEEVKEVAADVEDFALTDLDSENDGFLSYVTGKIQNNKDRTMSYMQVTINLYDKDENVIGTALDNINNIGPGEVWSFKAAILNPENVKSYKVTEITGF